jgi:lipopolysaccharide export system permease protein
LLGVLDRLLVRESLKTLLAVLTVLVLILAGNGFMRLLRSVAAGAIAEDVLARMIGLTLLDALGQVLPPAFFLAILFTLGRMYRDNEMTALLASGIGPWRVFRSFLLLAIPLALAVGWLTMAVKPWAKLQMREIRAEQRETAKLSGALAGQFNEFQAGGLVFYVEEVSGNGERMRNIFVQHRSHGRVGLVRAERGRHFRDQASGDRFVELYDGHRYEGSPGSADYTIGEFERYAMRIARPEPVESQYRNEGTMPTGELLGSDDIRARAELQYRLSYPLAVIVFTVLAMPLSRSLPRQGMYARLITAFLVYFVFMNLMEVAGSWMRAGVTPAWAGRWWVHLVMLGVAGWLLARDSMWLSRRRRGRGVGG